MLGLEYSVLGDKNLKFVEVKCMLFYLIVKFGIVKFIDKLLVLMLKKCGERWLE